MGRLDLAGAAQGAGLVRPVRLDPQPGHAQVGGGQRLVEVGGEAQPLLDQGAGVVVARLPQRHLGQPGPWPPSSSLFTNGALGALPLEVAPGDGEAATAQLDLGEPDRVLPGPLARARVPHHPLGLVPAPEPVEAVGGVRLEGGHEVALAEPGQGDGGGLEPAQGLLPASGREGVGEQVPVAAHLLLGVAVGLGHAQRRLQEPQPLVHVLEGAGDRPEGVEGEVLGLGRADGGWAGTSSTARRWRASASAWSRVSQTKRARRSWSTPASSARSRGRRGRWPPGQVGGGVRVATLIGVLGRRRRMSTLAAPASSAASATWSQTARARSWRWRPSAKA